MDATYIPVHRQASNLSEREICVRPDLGHVEDVPPIFFGLGRLHDLHVNVPDRVVAFLNCLEKILDVMVRILSGYLGSFFSGHVLHSDRRLDVEFHIFVGSILLMLGLLSIIKVALTSFVSLYVCPL